MWWLVFMVNLTEFRIAKELLYSFPTILGRACGPSICVSIRTSRYGRCLGFTWISNLNSHNMYISNFSIVQNTLIKSIYLIKKELFGLSSSSWTIMVGTQQQTGSSCRAISKAAWFLACTPDLYSGSSCLFSYWVEDFFKTEIIYLLCWKILNYGFNF